jgi:hypothetical protein
MKVYFHISDVLSVTTGRLVSTRHIDGVYDILNFLTGDNLFTHQLPRANKECEPWLRTQFPQLFADSPDMPQLLKALDMMLEASKRGDGCGIEQACRRRVEMVRVQFDLPEQVLVYEMGEGMHTYIDPIEEAVAMVGKERVIVVETPPE